MKLLGADNIGAMSLDRKVILIDNWMGDGSHY